jgi:hypothetical protein
MKLSKLGTTVIVIFVVALTVVIIVRHNNAHGGLVPERGYQYIPLNGGTCAAINPGCGYCYGKVIDKICYVEPNSPYAE